MDILYEAAIAGIDFIENYRQEIRVYFLVCISISMVVGFFPLTFKENDASTLEVLTVFIRRLALSSIFIIMPTLLLFHYAINKAYSSKEIDFFSYSLKTLYGFRGALPLYMSVIIGSFTLKIIFKRNILPYISHLRREFRVRQTNEEKSDIRSEIDRLKTLEYDPLDYIKDGFIFWGLDENKNPVYESEEVFKKRHIKFVGPTQTGKGVIQGLIIYQSIIKGWCTGFFDIKPDDFIYSIMIKACKDSGRPAPIVVDLNGVGPGSYNMFVNGTKRDILSRIQTAVDINERGTSADFYSAKERSLMIDIQEHFDGTLGTLEQLLMGNMPNGENHPRNYEITEKSRAYVKEMKSHKPINPKKGRGFNVDRTLNENAVFYVRGSITDRLVKKVQTVMLMDVIQSVIRLGKRDTHFYLAIDEVRFLVSDMLSTGLSTVLSKGMNMSVAYQTPANLLALDDATLNANAIKSEIEVNTLTTLTYRAGDDETAEWAAKLTGTRNKTIVRSEEISYEEMGGEEYTGRVQVHQDQEELISQNTMLALPPMVGALIRPNKLTSLLYTSYIKLKSDEMFDIAKPTKKERKELEQVMHDEKNDDDEDFNLDDFLTEAGIKK